MTQRKMAKIFLSIILVSIVGTATSEAAPAKTKPKVPNGVAKSSSKSNSTTVTTDNGKMADLRCPVKFNIVITSAKYAIASVNKNTATTGCKDTDALQEAKSTCQNVQLCLIRSADPSKITKCMARPLAISYLCKSQSPSTQGGATETEVSKAAATTMPATKRTNAKGAETTAALPGSMMIGALLN